MKLTDEQIKSIHYTLCDTVGSDYKTMAHAIESTVLEQHKKEMQEQCRIIGMGAERELALLSKLEEQKKLILQMTEALGDCLEDSRDALTHQILTYGENYRPERVAYMRKTVTDAEAVLTAAQRMV